MSDNKKPAEMLNELITFLKSREDVKIIKLKKGKPASLDLIEKYQKKYRDKLPDDLLEFYRVMNGIQFEWEFKENRIDDPACLYIPPIEKLKFKPAESYYIGDLQEKFFDVKITPIDFHHSNAVSFLTDENRVLFANHTAKNGLIFIAKSFSEYIKKGCFSYFAFYWMQNDQYAKETIRKTVSRLNEKPVKSQKATVQSREK